MPEILVRSDGAQALKHPENYREVGVHPITKQRGRFAVRESKPVQIWDKAAHKMKWVRRVEVEALPERDDGSTVIVIAQGGMGAHDFEEISQELSESRKAGRRNRPTFAPRAALIEEACREIRLRGTDSYQVGNQTFTRPSVGLLIPRNAEWAKRLAAESQRETL